MKRYNWLVGVAFAGLMVATSASVRAAGDKVPGGIGLQVADTAARSEGLLDITGGALFGEDIRFYGARETYAVTPDWRLFLDLGIVDVKGGGNDLGLQGGTVVVLPGEYATDLAVRGAIYGYVDAVGVNAMLLSSGETLLNGIFLYGGVGMDIARLDKADHNSTEVNPSLALGIRANFTERLSAYVEVSYVDAMFGGIGLRLR